MDYQQYYNSLAKPFFAPPSNIFGIVWPFLYIIITISFGWVIYQTLIKKRWGKQLLIPFVINLISNALYSSLFFNWQRPLLATFDILVVLTTIIWIICLMWRKARWVSFAQIPYLLWVSFATLLQISILVKNW
jgi:tryptophan-rich sensory protein